MGSFFWEVDDKKGKNPAEYSVSHDYNQSSGILKQQHEAEALLHVAKQKPILVVADTNHVEADAVQILSNPGFIKGLAD